MFISRTLSRFSDNDIVLDRPRPGRPLTAKTVSLTYRVLHRIKRIRLEASEKWPRKRKQTGNRCGGWFVRIGDETLRNA